MFFETEGVAYKSILLWTEGVKFSKEVWQCVVIIKHAL
jgi:hypothetical protein